MLFRSPANGQTLRVSVLVFADSGRKKDYGQLSTLSRILFRSFAKNSIFHTLSWSSQNSKCFVKSVGAAEMSAASEGIDEAKVLRKVVAILLRISVDLAVVVDSKDLYTSRSNADELS